MMGFKSIHRLKVSSKHAILKPWTEGVSDSFLLS